MIKPSSDDAPIYLGLAWSTDEANKTLAEAVVTALHQNGHAVAVVQGELFKYIDDTYGDDISLMYRLQPVGPLTNGANNQDTSYLSARDVVLAAVMDLAPFGWSRKNPVHVFAHDGMMQRMYKMVHELFKVDEVILEVGVYAKYDPQAPQLWTRTRDLFHAHESRIISQWSAGNHGYIVTLPS